MTTCRRLRSVLFRAAEGEADPDETLQAARHLADCTGCRILLARERRLARMLDGLTDVVAVQESFPEGVMAALPEAPPASERELTLRRGLRLAVLAGTLALAGALGYRIAHLARNGSFVSISPRFDVEGTGRFLDGLGGIGRFAAVFIEQLRDGLALDLSGIAGGFLLNLARSAPAVIVLLFLLFVAATVWASGTSKPNSAANR